jgi:hypothetical protein
MFCGAGFWVKERRRNPGRREYALTRREASSSSFTPGKAVRRAGPDICWHPHSELRVDLDVTSADRGHRIIVLVGAKLVVVHHRVAGV